MHKTVAAVCRGTAAWSPLAVFARKEERRPSADRLPGTTPPTVQRTPIGDLPDPDVDAVLAHTKMLSSDRVRGPRPRHEGRRPDGHVPRRSVQEDRPQAGQHRRHLRAESAARRHHAGTGPARLHARAARSSGSTWKDDVVAWTKHVADSAALDDSELVFVGYGVVAPEFNWDDYKGLDVKRQDAGHARERSARARSGEPGRARPEDVRRARR